MRGEPTVGVGLHGLRARAGSLSHPHVLPAFVYFPHRYASRWSGDAAASRIGAGLGGMMGPHPGGLSTGEGKRLAWAVAGLSLCAGPSARCSLCWAT